MFENDNINMIFVLKLCVKVKLKNMLNKSYIPVKSYNIKINGTTVLYKIFLSIHRSRIQLKNSK